MMLLKKIRSIPDSLEESAQLDGAGYTTIFLKIYSPLCKPVYATVALFVAVECGRYRNADIRSCGSNDYYHVTDHLYLSILAEVFRNRTYTRWCKGIKSS